MNPLADKGVIVTGGASGIGRATVELLLGAGANVLIVDLRQEPIDEALAELQNTGGGAVYGCAADVRRKEDCDRFVAVAGEKLGKIDALVHSAGILRPPGGRPRALHETDEEEYDAVVGTNLRGTFLVNRAVLRVMVAQKSGQVINISSTSGKKGRPLDSVYSASKAGVIGLSESAAEEVRPYGIRVQVILPDAVATPLWDQNGPLPPPPGALPAERVAEVILFCLSLPEDTMCENLVVAPLAMRKLRGKAKRST